MKGGVKMGLSLTYDGRRVTKSQMNQLLDYISDLHDANRVFVVKKTIGHWLRKECDFIFQSAANQSEQVINLGAIIPARARILDVLLITENVFTGVTTLVAEVGNTSSGHELINSATIYAENAVLCMAADHSMTVAPNVAATNVYVSATPGANWSSLTAGKVSVYITYIDNVVIS